MNEYTALDQFMNVGDHPYLNPPQHVIVRAVRNLPRVEALALIRGCYRDNNGGFASLREAQEIYSIIMQERG